MRSKITWPDEPKIGFALKVIRERALMTQRALAEKLGCSHSHVAKIETGAERIDLGEFFLWCEILLIEPADALQQIMNRH
jgi:transcriptional regulator with XRE-family HTH domain